MAAPLAPRAGGAGKYSEGTLGMSSTEPRVRTVIFTAPERIDQEWVSRLAASGEIDLLERVALMNNAGDVARRLRPELVIIERELGQAEIGVRQVLAAAPDAYCVVVLPDPDLPTLRRMMAAGARDVLAAPAGTGDLLAAARQARALAAERRKATTAVAGPQRGKLIVVTAPKGGVGTTTVATNIAVALRQVSGSPVALVDCSLQFGDVGVHLNLRSKYSMLDLAGAATEIDDAMLARVICEHESGVHALLAPPEPESAGHVDGAAVGAVIDRLLARYSFVVVDTWSFLDEVTETLVRRADEMLLVATPELPTLRNTKRLIEFAQRHDIDTSRVLIVLNRFPSVEGISLEDVQQHLRHPVAANIPSEGMAVTHSINRGVPLVISAPKGWAAQNILRLAARLAGDDVATITLTADEARRTGQKAEGKLGIFKFARKGA
jgi:pilus assembly protein CpaE